MIAGGLKGAFLRAFHPMLDLGEDLLDRIEVWRIGRQEQKPCPSLLDRLANGLAFVAAKVVHDDDVARFQDRHQQLLDVCPEALAVDRTVKDARRGKPVPAQGANKGLCVPAS